ncbi:MAG: serpin family protein [Butyrivibrio sp.]|nr:serpin family protein [Butyrivibrio sp.]
MKAKGSLVGSDFVKNRLIYKLLNLVLMAGLTVNILGCGGSAPASEIDEVNTDTSEEAETLEVNEDSYEDITENTDSKENAMAQDVSKPAGNLAISILKNDYSENALVSPLSVMMAGGMVLNGSASETKDELMNVLGLEDIDSFNASMKSFMEINDDPENKLKFANGIWVNGDDILLDTYKTKMEDLYGAKLCDEPFSDETLSDVNQFVYDNTDGMIDKIIDSVPSLSNMILVDALSFEGKWDKAFEDEDIDENGTFTLEDGSSKTVTMLNGKAGEYFEVSGGCGFIYPYKGDRYSFAAILPEEGTKMQDFISNVSGEEIVDSMKNCEYTRVVFSIPEFTFDCSMELSDTFRKMGANRVFTGDADFSNMLTENGKFSLDSILHKTHIELNREGTKAAAVTGMVLNSAGPGKADVKQVILDRPFIYMIIDNETKTPIFMGHADNIE